MTASAETHAAGDPDAGVRVAALYEEHGRTVLGLCRFLLRDFAEAEDAAQQSFLSAYRSLLTGNEPREPAAWLATIARNECRARIRRRMREPLAVHAVSVDSADPLEIALRHADLDALRAGLGRLSRPQREAFLLREFAGLSYGELATALGVTEPAVDSLLFRARTRLRRALGTVNGLLLPVVLREQLAQLIPGFEQPSTGTLAKLASLPIAAKLAAAGAGAVLVVAGSAGFGSQSVGTRHDGVVAAPMIQRERPAASTRSSSAPALRLVPPRPPSSSSSAVTRVVGPRSPSRAGEETGAETSDSSTAGPTEPQPSSRSEPTSDGPDAADRPTGGDDGVPATSELAPSDPTAGSAGPISGGEGMLVPDNSPTESQPVDDGGSPGSEPTAGGSGEGSGDSGSVTAGSSSTETRDVSNDGSGEGSGDASDDPSGDGR